MKKYSIDVKTIKYQDQEIPTAVIFNQKLYLISAITSVQHNVVFSGGGVGTKYAITVNKKETYLFQDKHSLKWHVYKEYANPVSGKIEKDDQIQYIVHDFDYLN